MGVPKLFKIILDKFPKSHQRVKGQPIDYFFVDFNSTIYEAYEKVKHGAKENGRDLTKLSRSDIEDLVIKKAVAINVEMVTDAVKPKKMVYFAFDGPPPRGKMRQQRDRRYKKLYESKVLQEIKDRYGIEEKEPWSTTWITPGTQFMAKMGHAMQRAIANGNFPSHLEYILSDVSIPGEGEHKFLKFLDKLPKSKVCIYSNDGDVLMLVNRFSQHEVFVLTKPKETSRVVVKNYAGEKYIYLVMDGLDEGFQNQFHKLDLKKIDLQKLKRDYIFFTMIGGNDFVQHIYFLRMKEEHTFKVLKGVYQHLFPKYGHLVGDGLKINQPFLLEYLIILAKQEVKWLQKKQREIEDSKPKKGANKKLADLEPWEKEWEMFQHTYYYKRDHPMHDKYKDEFSKIDYFLKPNSAWKKQYYQEFFGVDYDDKKEINRICYQYLKSWIYCLRYYLDELPSWGWYYPHGAAPLPSDLVRTLQRIRDINDTFKFEKGRSFRPLEQLMLVLPKENQILGGKFRKIMDELPEFYPDKFKLDVLWGLKYIYSEPDLPNINAKVVLAALRKLELTKEEEELNHLYDQPLYYPVTKPKK